MKWRLISQDEKTLRRKFKRNKTYIKVIGCEDVIDKKFTSTDHLFEVFLAEGFFYKNIYSIEKYNSQTDTVIASDIKLDYKKVNAINWMYLTRKAMNKIPSVSLSVSISVHIEIYLKNNYKKFNLNDNFIIIANLKRKQALQFIRHYTKIIDIYNSNVLYGDSVLVITDKSLAAAAALGIETHNHIKIPVSFDQSYLDIANN